MLAGCTDQDTRYKFERLIDDGKKSYEAAARLIDGVCKSPAFQVRTEKGHGFNFDHHLNQKGILIIEGGVGGALSLDAMKTMMGAIILKTLSFLAERKRKFPEVILCLDEVNNYNLIGEAGHEVKALATHRAYGLAMHIMAQRLDFPSGITEGVMTNCDTKKYMRSPHVGTANILGADLGGGYETSGTKTHHLRDGSSWDSPIMVNNPFADELRNFIVGECYVRLSNKNEKMRVTPLPDPFGMSEQTLKHIVDGLVEQVKKRDEYYSPMDDLFNPLEAGGDSPIPGDDPESPPGKPKSDDDPLGIF